MSTPGEHSTLSISLDIDDLAGAIAERVQRRLEHARAAGPTLSSVLTEAISPTKLYTVREAALVMGISEKQVRDIPPEELPRRHVGQAGTGVRFLGLFLIAYLIGANCSELRRSLVESARSAYVRRAATPMQRGGKTRIH